MPNSARENIMQAWQESERTELKVINKSFLRVFLLLSNKFVRNCSKLISIHPNADTLIHHSNHPSLNRVESQTVKLWLQITSNICNVISATARRRSFLVPTFLNRDSIVFATCRRNLSRKKHLSRAWSPGFKSSFSLASTKRASWIYR